MLALAGGSVGLAALAMEALLLRGFWYGTQALAPGTSIRPMGLAAAIGIIAIGALLLGCPLSGMGLVLGVKNRHQWIVVLAVVGLCFCLAPLPVSIETFHYLAGKRGLNLED